MLVPKLYVPVVAVVAVVVVVVVGVAVVGASARRVREGNTAVAQPDLGFVVFAAVPVVVVAVGAAFVAVARIAVVVFVAVVPAVFAVAVVGVFAVGAIKVAVAVACWHTVALVAAQSLNTLRTVSGGGPIGGSANYFRSQKTSDSSQGYQASNICQTPISSKRIIVSSFHFPSLLHPFSFSCASSSFFHPLFLHTYLQCAVLVMCCFQCIVLGKRCSHDRHCKSCSASTAT